MSVCTHRDGQSSEKAYSSGAELLVVKLCGERKEKRKENTRGRYSFESAGSLRSNNSFGKRPCWESERCSSHNNNNNNTKSFLPVRSSPAFTSALNCCGESRSGPADTLNHGAFVLNPGNNQSSHSMSPFSRRTLYNKNIYYFTMLPLSPPLPHVEMIHLVQH